MSGPPAPATAPRADVWVGATPSPPPGGTPENDPQPAVQAPAGRGLITRLPWVRRAEPAEVPTVVPPLVVQPLAAAPAAVVDVVRDAARMAAARAAWNDGLWGDGYLMPGGELEIGRLTAPLPLSPANTLLLLGRDAGGAAAAVARQRGAWIAAHQHDPACGERMAARVAPLGRRVEVKPWRPEAPAFRPNFHAHALALEPLRALPAADPAALLAALATGLKASGQLVLVELVAGPAAARHAPALERWMALEERGAAPPPAAVIEAALRSAGFRPHVVENLATRHLNAVIDGWVGLLDGLRAERPQGAAAAALVEEAECWLLRHRLLGAGAISLMRWHATLT